MIVTNGFAPNTEFKNPYFEIQKQFNYFGTLNWTPTISIWNNPNFEVKFTKGNKKGNKKGICVHIEGFTTVGSSYLKLNNSSFLNTLLYITVIILQIIL